MSGVMRSTVWPLASVVMEDGGRRNTSFPWIRKLVAVRGMPLPAWAFMPSCPVIATCLMIFWPATFWMTVVEEVLVAELPGELVTGLTAGLGAADSPVTVMPVCLVTELPGLCTCTGLV